MQDGFDLGVLSLPGGFGKPPKNYDTLLHFSDKPAAILAKDLELGVIEAFVPSPGQKCVFHPLGAVPKGLDDCRIVKDSSACGFNDASVKTAMTLPDIRTIINAKEGVVRGHF